MQSLTTAENPAGWLTLKVPVSVSLAKGFREGAMFALLLCGLLGILTLVLVPLKQTLKSTELSFKATPSVLPQTSSLIKATGIVIRNGGTFFIQPYGNCYLAHKRTEAKREDFRKHINMGLRKP